MLRSFKQNPILILSILVILSPFIYLNRIPLTNLYFKFTDLVFPLKPGTVPWLSTSGNQIVADGQPILLRGVNIASNQWSIQYKLWHPQAVAAAADTWHANIIRTRIFERDFVTNPYIFFRDLEKEIIKPAREKHLYVILHPWLGDNTSLPTADTKAMWVAIAKRYRNDPTIVYDLLAEPRDIEMSQLRSAYEDLIPAIRKVNPDALIFVTGLDWGRDINIWAQAPLPYKNLVYRTNPYNKQGEIEGYFMQLTATQPVFIGEFGISQDLTMTPPDVDFLLKLANRYQLGWTAWNFSASGCPCLLSDEQHFTPSEYGTQVFDFLSGNQATLAQAIDLPDNATRFYIYADFLNNGFTDYSWDMLRDLKSRDTVYQGSTSLKANFVTQSGGLYLHSSRVISARNYQNLTLHLQGAHTDQLSLRFRSSSDTLSDPVLLKDFIQGSDNSWQTVTIPLSQSNLDSFSSLMIEPTGNSAPLGTIYFDEIYLSP